VTTTYTISELARALDVTPRTIRFYEEQGMLAPERRGQERVFHPRDLVTLKLILRGKRLGFSLVECKELIDLYDPAGNRRQLARFMEKIEERRHQLKQQMLDIEQMHLELDTAEERCRLALEQVADPS
jgi:DNA-binding transcriptional MerR regulator